MRKIYIVDYLFGFIIISFVWACICGFFLGGFWFAELFYLFPVYLLFLVVFIGIFYNSSQLKQGARDKPLVRYILITAGICALNLGVFLLTRSMLFFQIL